jgi:hypothetical protein
MSPYWFASTGFLLPAASPVEAKGRTRRMPESGR